VRWLKNYFLWCGVLAHVGVALGWFLLPELVYEAKQKLKRELQEQGYLATPPPQLQIAADLPSQIQQVFKTWQPDLTRFPEKKGIWLNEREVADLTTALNQLKAGDLLQIGSGTYQQALTIDVDDVTIEGLGKVVFENATANEKAMFYIKGNRVAIKNLECSGIKVADGNGACVRFEGQGLTLDHVYFHHSQTGLLETSAKGGSIIVQNSRFEQLGHAGQAHGIYLNTANLLFDRSLMIAAKDAGHGIKNRGASTIISKSILATLGSDDSRLVDISNGGQLQISDSILQEGAYSQNFQLLGFGLEGLKYQDNSVKLTRNLIISDRTEPSHLLKVANNTVSVSATENLLIGDILHDYPENRMIDSREDAGLAAAPMLPFTVAICGSNGAENPACPLHEMK
jgi:hypothetical protein